MKDMFGVEIEVGDVVLRPCQLGSSPLIEKRIVTSIVNGKIYLDNSKVAIVYPDRLVVYS